jgi:hypothetical protein
MHGNFRRRHGKSTLASRESTLPKSTIATAPFSFLLGLSRAAREAISRSTSLPASWFRNPDGNQPAALQQGFSGALPAVKLRKGKRRDACGASGVDLFGLQNALRSNVAECKMRVSGQLETEIKLPLRPADRRHIDD